MGRSITLRYMRLCLIPWGGTDASRERDAERYEARGSLAVEVIVVGKVVVLEGLGELPKPSAYCAYSKVLDSGAMLTLP